MDSLKSDIVSLSAFTYLLSSRNETSNTFKLICLAGSLQFVNLFVLYKKNEHRSHWNMWGKMFWSLDLFSVATLSRSKQPQVVAEEEKSEVYWFDIWNVIVWMFFMFIYVFTCCSVNMLALMKAAFTQVPEVSPAHAALLACSLLSSLACIHPSFPQ